MGTDDRRYTSSEAAGITGVMKDQQLDWRRRGLMPPRPSESWRSWYSRAELCRLRLLGALIGLGVPIGTAIEMLDAEASIAETLDATLTRIERAYRNGEELDSYAKPLAVLVPQRDGSWQWFTAFRLDAIRIEYADDYGGLPPFSVIDLSREAMQMLIRMKLLDKLPP
jgi:DNA-binding transcriptional MerR regulator